MPPALFFWFLPVYAPPTVRDLVFFYGTLMAGFDRRQRAGMDANLKYLGRGSIRAALFDLGLYPAAVPAPDGVVWGELYEVVDAPTVLAALDEIEGYRPDDHDRSLYVRSRVDGRPAGRQQRVRLGLLLQRPPRRRQPDRIGGLS